VMLPGNKCIFMPSFSF